MPWGAGAKGATESVHSFVTFFTEGLPEGLGFISVKKEGVSKAPAQVPGH